MTSCKTTLSFAVLLLTTLAAAQGTYTQFDFPGATFTYPAGIDTAGDIIGSYYSGSYSQGFLLSGGTYTTIDYSESDPEAQLFGINDVGEVVGWTDAEGIGFVYNMQTHTITPVNYPGAVTTVPFGINDAGTIVGVLGYTTPQTGFKLTALGRGQLIAVPNVQATWVTGISASGEVVGYCIPNSIEQFTGFSLNAGKFQHVAIPDAVVTGTNPAGTALVGYYYLQNAGDTAGFVYQNGHLTTLQFPGTTSTHATGINAAGEVVGYFQTSNYSSDGFTWTPPADAANK
jgi:probable HAF family extracellular repeat protein